MRPKSQSLFSKGAFNGQPSLSNVLEGHLQSILSKIRKVSDLDQMTDAFLERLVKDSVVESLTVHFDRMTRKLRTEEFDGADFPANFAVERGRRYPKQVARISIPFSGDPKLLEHTPSPFGATFPQGDVSGNTIQFDVIMMGYADDAERAKNQIKSNRELMDFYVANANRNVKAFNESLPDRVKAAFTAKLDELTKQHAVFDDLGIPEEPEPIASRTGPIVQQPTKGKARAVQIIQIIENQYVQQLNQTNNNTGDVNNAIQSD